MGAGASVGAEECSTLEQDIRQLCDTGIFDAAVVYIVTLTV